MLLKDKKLLNLIISMKAGESITVSYYDYSKSACKNIIANARIRLKQTPVKISVKTHKNEGVGGIIISAIKR